MDYIICLTVFNTCISLIFCGIIISFFIGKQKEKQEFNKLEDTWKNDKDQVLYDYKQYKQVLQKKMDDYLKKYLKFDCFNCNLFDEKKDGELFCIVEGQCPGNDLSKSERIQILRDKDKWLERLKELTEQRGY